MTAGTIAELVSAVAACGAVFLGLLNRNKIQQVHVLVNNQLDKVMTRLDNSVAKVKELERNKPDDSHDV